MPPVLNQISGGRWDNLLRRLFPIKETSIAPVLASELVGYVTVQEWEPELFKLRDEALCIAFTQQTQVAAEFAHTQLRNPDDSGNIIVLERVHVGILDATNIEIAYNPIALTGSTVAASAFRDQRFSPTPNIASTTGQPRFVSSAVVLGTAAVGRIDMDLAQSIDVQLDMVIPPGQSVVLRGGSTAAGIDVMWFWRERAAEPSELAA